MRTLFVLLLCAAFVPFDGRAETVHRGHAIAMHGQPKYPAGFPHVVGLVVVVGAGVGGVGRG
ncbi:MAG: hypothetical protein OXG99_15800, partial [Alphaproteobacteria bacterium]|nr:hypothetical protein [Alphaproteobacteria bacterium]